MTGTMKSSYGGAVNTAGRRNTGPSSMRQSNSVGHLSAAAFGSPASGSHFYRQPTAFGDDNDDAEGTLLAGKKIKRTKSMWKFKKSGGGGDEVLTGMSMWRHRSLVDVNAAEAEEQLQQHNGFINGKSSAGTPVASKKFTIACRDIDIVDDDDSQTIMNGTGGGGGSSTVRRVTHGSSSNGAKRPQQNRGDDRNHGGSRRSSSSSFGGGGDSESCIVVDDHQLKDARTPGRPASAACNLLPRTRLIKQTAAVGSPMLLPPPPPPPAVRSATADDGGYAQQHDSDADVRFESSKLQTFKYMNAANNDGWYDSWGEKRKK